MSNTTFDMPILHDGDVYARYMVRMEEMRQSVRIVQQALDQLPYGPVRSENRKYVPPPSLRVERKYGSRHPPF